MHSTAPAASASSDISVPTFLPAGTPILHFSWDKTFHVSPFMGLDQVYHWDFSTPGERLMTRSLNTRKEDGVKMFTTQLLLEKSKGPLRPLQLAWAVLVAFPLLTWRLQVWIHYEAVRLFRKGVPLYPHPTGATTPATRAVEAVVEAVLAVLGFIKALYRLLCCKARKQAAPAPSSSGALGQAEATGGKVDAREEQGTQGAASPASKSRARAGTRSR